MHDKHLFEYAVIRLVPKVEREEFINVGVIVLCKKSGYLKMQYRLNKEKLSLLFPELDLNEVTHLLQGFEAICNGENGGPIGKLSPPERFRWLTATRSTVLQTSKVHPGICVDPPSQLERLFGQLVD